MLIIQRTNITNKLIDFLPPTNISTHLESLLDKWVIFY